MTGDDRAPFERYPLRHDADGSDRLELGDLLNRVLDKGVVIHGEVMIAVADVDLVRLDLTLVLYAAETAARRAMNARASGARSADGEAPGADVRVLPADGGR